MDFYSFAPIAAALNGAYSVVLTIADWISPITAGASAAVAIVLITVLVRAALIPVGRSQVRAEITRARLAPQLQELQRKYKNKPELLQRKTMELYAREKASPFAGCLPALAQAPVLSLVYGLFIHLEIAGHQNLLLSANLGGVPLGTSLVSLLASGQALSGVLVFGTLLAVIATTAWFSRRTTQAFAARNATAQALAPLHNLSGALSWLPFLTVVFASMVPLAATIYLSVTTTWTLIERVVLRRILNP